MKTSAEHEDHFAAVMKSPAGQVDTVQAVLVSHLSHFDWPVVVASLKAIRSPLYMMGNRRTIAEVDHTQQIQNQLLIPHTGGRMGPRK